MGLLTWVKALGTKKPIAQTGNIEQMQLQGLDVSAAIAAHRNWKIRLESYVKGTSTEQLDHAVICKDNNCALGKWIYSDSCVTMSDIGVFQELKEIHAKFHIAAGKIVELTDSGEHEMALLELERGEYPRHSARVQTKLASLFQHFSKNK